MTRRERLERKLERRQEWAAKAEGRSEARFNAAHRLADSIPLGQPILVGHHSEKRARRDADRIHSNMSKGCEEAKLASHHTAKAGGLASQLDRSIFSDDENAVEALEQRVAQLEAERERMKLVNKLYRKGDAAGLAALGLNLDTLCQRVASVGLSWVKAPFESYQLSNLGGRISTDRKRLADIRARQQRASAAEAAADGVLVETSPDWHGFGRITFAEKPDRQTLDALRAAGWRWGGGHWSGNLADLPPGIIPGADTNPGAPA